MKERKRERNKEVKKQRNKERKKQRKKERKKKATPTSSEVGCDDIGLLPCLVDCNTRAVFLLQ
jgi:hypothetical protein